MISVFVAHAILAGVMCVLAVILGQVSSGPYVPLFPLTIVGLIGFTQFLYVFPLMIWSGQGRHFARVQGVIIGAVLTLLLNGGCFVIFTMG